MIHILGTGNIGKLVAHSLRGCNDPAPVTLLFHRPSMIEEWEKSNKTITITTNGASQEQSGFDVELALPYRHHEGRGKHGTIPSHEEVSADYQRWIKDDTIHNLIVTLKCPQTLSALDAIKHRLTKDSTILFMQNGMGVTDEVSREIFPDPETRPTYAFGINSHGVFSTGTFASEHAGNGVIWLGIVPRGKLSITAAEGEQNETAPTARYILRALARSPTLAAVALPPNELFQAQLEKLAVNCIINPLTVLIDSRNGDILENQNFDRARRLLLAEICLVIQNLPELKGVPNVQSRFSMSRIEGLVKDVAEKTAKNISSMLADTRRGQRTEIEYINGYIVRRGEELGIKPVMNYLMVQLVEGKTKMIGREIRDYVPMRSRSARSKI